MMIIKWPLKFVFFLFPFFVFASPATPLKSINIYFYGEKIALNYNPEMVFKYSVSCKDKYIKEYYEKMESSGAAKDLVEQLMTFQKSTKLNDYLYYLLVRRACTNIYKDLKTDKKEILYTTAIWYIMNKSGYQTRLSNAGLKALFLNVASKDKVYGMGRIPLDGKSYYNLTAYYHQLKISTSALTINKFNPEAGDKEFVFSITSLPELKPRLVNKILEFESHGENHRLDLQLDSNSMNIMRDYPKLKDTDYLKVPISKTAASSLLPQLQNLIDGKSNQESVEVLVAFCRKSFDYKWDWDLYDDDQPAIADQVFFLPYSDHEDRVALFFYLVKELLDLPMVVIAHFNNNLTIGVDLGNVVGDPIKYNDRNYTICDPTTPKNSEKLGKYPSGFKSAPVTVVGEYEPGDDNLQGL